jgi:hypothetical protein
VSARLVCPEHGRVTDDGGPWPRECTRWAWDEDGTPVPCPVLATRQDVARATARA